MNIKIMHRSCSLTVEDAWKISRPNLTEINMDEVYKLDLPVNEFSMMYLEITSTIFEREVIASMRDHIMWAQTSRVQNPLEFKMDIKFSNHKTAFEYIRKLMKEESEKSNQDTWRMKLPVFSLTTYSIGISARKLIKLAKYFEYLRDFCADKDILLSNIFDNAQFGLFQACEYLGYPKEITNRYKMQKILNEDKVPIKNERIGDFAILTVKSNIALRTHLVRHREILIADNLFELLSSEKTKGATSTLEEDLTISVAGKIQDLKKIVSQRSCWIAHHNLWKDFIDNYMEITGEKSETLPCYGKDICPFSSDAEARYTNKDPNPPCPIHARLNNKALSAKQLNEMSNYAIEERRPVFWQEEIFKFNSGSIT